MLNEEMQTEYFVFGPDTLVIQEEVGPLSIHGIYSVGKMQCFPRLDLTKAGPVKSHWKFAAKWNGEVLKTNLQCPPECDPLILKAGWFVIEDLNHRTMWFDRSISRKKFFAELERDQKFLRMATTILLSGHDVGVPAHLSANTEDIPAYMPECAVQWACRAVNGMKQSEQFGSIKAIA